MGPGKINSSNKSEFVGNYYKCKIKKKERKKLYRLHIVTSFQRVQHGMGGDK